MEASRSKIEFIKPVILKAGIPLAVSVTCLVWSKIISTRRAIKDDDEEVVEGLCFETEASNMKRLVESLQEREQRLEMQFLRFCELKDREIALVEIGNRLKMEMERVEVLNREVSSMEAENQRMREYVKVLGEMKLWKLESRVLRRKMKKLSRTRTQQSDLLRESCRRIEAQEMEVSRGRKDMEEERSSVKKLEDDVGELRRRFEQMEMEKKEILVKLNSADQSAPSKTNDEALAMEEYSHMLKGMEHLQKEHEEEEEELVHLRWSNACLRHKLLRSGVGEDQEQTTSPKSNANSSTTELAVAEQNHGQDLESKLNRSASAAHATTSSSFHGSKRKKILQKLRKWVEGSDHQKVKHREIIGGEKNRKCFGQISVSDEAEEEVNEDIIHARRSCSSV